MTKPVRIAIVVSLLAAVPLAPYGATATAQQQAHTVDRDSVTVDSAANAQPLETLRIEGRRDRNRYAPGFSRTALKTTALAREVPQSLTTVTSALIRDQGMRSMAEVVRYVPGISMGQGEGNRDQPTIRGNSSTADFFVDGVRDDAQYFRDLYNVERVEALKGSNAMVFGRGGGGGLLNRVTKEASWISSREVAAEAGTFGGRRVSADLQQDISPVLAARLNTVYENSDLFRDGSFIERTGLNPTATFSSLSRKARVTLGYEHFHDRRTADRGIPSFQGKPVDTEPSTFFGNPDESVARIGIDAVNATASYDAGSMQIRNTTRYTGYDKFYQNVYPGAVTSTGTDVNIVAYNHSIERRNAFNQTDLIWRAHTGSVAHDVLVGAELGRQSTDSRRATGYFGAATSMLVPVSNPVALAPVAFRQSATDADNGTVVTTRSVYLQDQLAFSPYLRLIAGARYEHFDVRFTDNRAGVIRSRADGMFSPRAGIVVKPAELVSIYASYGLSFLPGSGDQFTTLTEVTRALRPERFANYEAGVKWDVLDRLALSAAIYRLDRTNTRATDPVDPTRLIQTGAQKSQGVELGATGSVSAKWELAAAFARQDASIVRATASSVAGARVPLVPRATFSLWNKYSLSAKLGAAVGAVRQSPVFAAIDNSVTLPGFTRFDGALFASIGGGLRAQINVENIFDIEYWPTANNNNNISPGSPRAARVSVTAEF